MRRVVALVTVVSALSPALARADDAPAPVAPPEPPAATAPVASIPVDPAPSAKAAAAEFSSLRLLREKGVITAAEYDAALRDMGASVGSLAADAPTLVVGRWSTTLYGFVETDLIADSTQSFADQAGNGQVQRQNGDVLPLPYVQNTYAGDHGRTQFSVRNSRFGLQLRAPEAAGVRGSATLEMDFLGFDPSLDPSINNRGETVYPYATGGSEAGFWNNPTMRLRQAYMKIETPIVDITVGQTWHIFGWQPVFHPNTVQIQGVPGELYARTAQVRLSKRIELGPTTLELAAAALRPPQRNSMMPELSGGLRFSIDRLTGMQTQGSTGTGLSPASIAVSGTMRNFALPNFEQVPKNSVAITTGAVAVDAFIPLIPATKGHEGNSLSLTGQFVMGGGIGDMFTGMQSGMTFPSLPNTTGVNPPPAYPQDIENGLVVYDTKTFDLHPIQWTAIMGGVQYYLPGLAGRVWLAGNYSHIASPNIAAYTRNDSSAPSPNEYNYAPAALVRESEDWFDACAFVDPTPALRLGLEYAHYDDKFADGKHAINHRAQVSGFFRF